jgi:type III secretory pathway lipoprotein EscJ
MPGRYRPAMADVTVATALTELEAEQVAALLRAEGIGSYVQGANASQFVPLQPIEIRVAEEDAARARELVDAGRKPPV